MSQFGQQYPQRPSGSYGVGGNPYRPSFQSGASKRPKQPSNKVGWIIGIVVGCVGLCVLCCCGGLIGFGMWTQADEEKELAEMLHHNPVLVRNIGTLQSFKTNWSESMDKEDWNIFVYTAVGSKGSGKITISSYYDDAGELAIDWAKLETEDGREYSLVEMMR